MIIFGYIWFTYGLLVKFSVEKRACVEVSGSTLEVLVETQCNHQTATRLLDRAAFHSLSPSLHFLHTPFQQQFTCINEVIVVIFALIIFRNTLITNIERDF